MMRFNIYEQNLQAINSHNARNLEWTAAINRFADLTPQEFSMHYKGFIAGSRPSDKLTDGRANAKAHSGSSPPASWDWVPRGAVAPVKDQGLCGSCWAFSAVGAMEGANFLKNQLLVSLSEQELIDCMPALSGCDGCNGGYMTPVFDFAKLSAMNTELSYPYLSGTNASLVEACLKQPIGVTMSSYVNVKSGDEDALKAAVYMQPCSVALDASQNSFQFYCNGTYSDPNCKNGVDDLDHAITAVGYGTDANGDYWLMKNSWGTGWGLLGFIKIKRNAKNMCGIATQASYAIAE